MKWSGKIIGGALGFALGLGPVGAALGAFIGHQFDSGAAPSDFFGRTFLGGAPNPALVNELFFPTTFRLMGHIAKADGRVSEQEIASARSIMHALRLTKHRSRPRSATSPRASSPDSTSMGRCVACERRSPRIRIWRNSS
jgi:DnaJ like chaperone protein